MIARDTDTSILAGIDVDRPTIARIYDYWLGGCHNFAPDRAVGDRIFALMPDLRTTIWANRSFLRRVVQHLVTECGISQFLDLGSGVPTVGNVHEIAERHDPDARVVYVDVDPVAVVHAWHLLESRPRAAAVRADLRDAAAVLGSPEVAEVLDLTRPVAVLMVSMLHFFPDDDDPAAILRAYTDALVPGSYVALSHVVRDSDAPRPQTTAVHDYQRTIGTSLVLRPPEDIAGWLAPFALCPPGLVPINRWRPDTAVGADVPAYGGLARVF